MRRAVHKVNAGGRLAAFTLVEMAIVVLILGIAAAVAVPRFAEALMRFRADAAANRVKADLEFARRRAKMQSAAQTVEFNASANSYKLSGIPDIDQPDKDYEVEIDQWPYEATIVSVSLGADDNLVFDGFGVPDSAGQIVIEAGGNQVTLDVEATTGHVSIP